MPHFVLGTGRSGTTLIHEVIARHEGVGFISNVDDKLSHLNLTGRWNRRLFQLSNGRDPALGQPFKHRKHILEMGRLRLAPSEAWSVLDRQLMPLFSRPYRDLLAGDVTPHLERQARAFFERRAAAQRCDVFLHKLTGWPRSGFLQAVFPDARFVHVVRDGRACANSWLQMGWWDGYRGAPSWYLGPLPADYLRQWRDAGESFHVLAAIGWCILLDAFESARALVPAEQWLDVRYEDVMARPEEEFARILDFLGLSWTKEFERGLRRHEFVAARVEAFRRDLSPEQIHAMERVMEPHLTAWGYALSEPRDSEGVTLVPVAS